MSKLALVSAVAATLSHNVAEEPTSNDTVADQAPESQDYAERAKIAAVVGRDEAKKVLSARDAAKVREALTALHLVFGGGSDPLPDLAKCAQNDYKLLFKRASDAIGDDRRIRREAKYKTLRVNIDKACLPYIAAARKAKSEYDAETLTLKAEWEKGKAEWDNAFQGVPQAFRAAIPGFPAFDRKTFSDTVAIPLTAFLDAFGLATEDYKNAEAGIVATLTDMKYTVKKNTKGDLRVWVNLSAFDTK